MEKTSLETKVKLILCSSENIKKRIDWKKAKLIMNDALTKIEDEALVIS